MDSKLTVLSEKEVVDLVDQSVQQALQKSLPTIIRRAQYPEYISTEQLCRLASWSKSKCYYLRQKDELKYVQHGRTVLYPTEWILNYLESHQIQPRKEVLEEIKSDSGF